MVASTSFSSVTVDALVSAAPAMAKHFGDHPNSVFLAQLMRVAPSISIIVDAPIAGYLSRKRGLRRLMVFCSLVYVATGCYGSIAPDPMSLILSRAARPDERDHGRLGVIPRRGNSIRNSRACCALRMPWRPPWRSPASSWAAS